MSLDLRRFILVAGLALAGGAVAAERLAHNAHGTTTARPAPP